MGVGNDYTKEMAVIVKAKNLLAHTCNMTANTERFPKKYRFSIAVRIENHAIDIYENLVRASECDLNDEREQQQRADCQQQVIVSCKLLNTLIEIAGKTPSIQIASKSVEYWSSLVVEVKKMTAKWRSNERQQRVNKK